FAPKSNWSRVFARQPEIEAYVRHTAERYGVLDRVRFGEPVETANWDDAANHWVIRTPHRTYHAQFVISCAGYLHEPLMPRLPGLAEFPGTIFHSSRWKHEHDLQDRRVAVIGTGASAIQFVPKIQPKVKSLHVFQRTPQWILPKPDARIGLFMRSGLALPGAMKLMREMLYRRLEELGGAFRHPEHMKRVQAVALRHLQKQVQDPELRAKLTPNYVLGCKRVLLSNDYYPALTQPNVEVLPMGVTEIRGNTVVGTDAAREVDTIILGTGFHVSDPPIAAHIRGAHGRTLAEVWSGSPEAYRGTTIAGFPNAFMVLGPNLAIGHNSAFIVIEAQLDYICDALTSLRREGVTRIEVRRDAQASYNRRVQRDLAGTVWNTGGCSSYYIDANGRNSIAFPWSTLRMRRILARFDIENYHATTPRRSLAAANNGVSAHV
ncbi:MAG TPA: NAD(P)/FAD-dependent oxidoreductase, partial [Polyangiaceae bacterium]|nr:NAD(P)/FAD-dependent oxidoreductase [Polyangiaceae bacterium]